MGCRYTRDQIIHRALLAAKLPNLIVHDMPDGVVSQDADMLFWLQEILDYFYTHCPVAMTVHSVELNCTAQSNQLILPEDFSIDVRNGYLHQMIPGDPYSYQRTQRTSYQK